MGGGWDSMLKCLAEFRDKHGHCNVPTNDPEQLKLGRWVSVQRYKRKVGELSNDRVVRLDDLEFVWSARDAAWQEMFRKLVAYVDEHQTVHIPERCPEYQKLASWVHSQRHRRNQGRLDSSRIKQLDKIGFNWVARGDEHDDFDYDEPRDPLVDRMEADDDHVVEERLYMVGAGVFIQYGGRGRRPRALVEFIRSHGGEYPPHISLPHGEVVFMMGNHYSGRSYIAWPGRGALPDEVMEYVQENGALPAHEEP